jgi:MFS family permease
MGKEVTPTLTDDQVRKSLKNSVLDGTAYSAMQGLTLNYITPYAITMKATTTQIGLLSSVPNFTMSLVQFAAPALSERAGSRKGFILPMVFLHALMWLPIMLVPYIFSSNLVWWLILFQTVGTAFDSVSNPPWGSMMADLVQQDLRGRFFGNRNRIMGIVSMTFSYLAGGILQLFTGNTRLAFIIIFSGAIASRLASFYFLSQMQEPLLAPTRKEERVSLFVISKGLFSTNVGKFIIFCSLVNLTTLIAGPFFTPYMLRELRYNYITYTVVNSASAATTLFFMTWWGRRTDRAGSIRVLKIAALMIPFIPLLWLVSGAVYWIIIAQMYSGFAWAGFQLASSIFIYDASPRENRTRFIALYNAMVFLGVSLGSLAGGFIAPYLPLIKGSHFLSVFLLSGLLRLVVIALFLPRISEVRNVKPVSIRDLMRPDIRYLDMRDSLSSIKRWGQRRKNRP